MNSTILNPRSTIAHLVIVLIAITVFASLAHACPTCKEGLATADPHHASVAAGYYYSILFMMSMPFAILGTFGGLAYLSIRRARGQQSLTEENDVPAAEQD